MAQYTVKSGDNLSTIAKTLGLPSYNSLSGYRSGNPNLIFPGEVLNYTDPNAAAAPPPPATAEQVQPYLTAAQQGISATSGLPDTRTPAQIQTDLTNATAVKDAQGNVIQRPTAPSLVDTFTKLKTDAGVGALEQSLNDLKAQAMDVKAMTQARTGNELNKAVPLGVISGRTSEVQRQQNEQLDAVNRNIAYVTDQLNTAYNGINMIMQFTQTDYQNAAASWDAKYKANIDMIGLVQSEKKLQADLNQQAFDNARATLNTYAQLIIENNFSYGQLSPDQKVQITKLEVQAGLPIGFMSKIKGKPLATTTLDDGRIQVLTLDSNGAVQTNLYGTAQPKNNGLTAYQAYQISADQTKAKADQLKSYVSSATGILKNVGNGDKWVDVTEAQQAYNNIKAIVGGDATLAMQVYSQAFNEAGKATYPPGSSYTIKK